MAITIEPDGTSDHGPCNCCGNMSRTVWGFLYDAGRPLAAYYVHWTLGRIDHGANFDLVTGAWGEQSSPQDRTVVAVAFRWMSSGPQFMIIDAQERPVAKSGSLAASAKRRDEVIGTPLASNLFAMLDAILLGDDRISELRGT
jgi:hypothetical protein